MLTKLKLKQKQHLTHFKNLTYLEKLIIQNRVNLLSFLVSISFVYFLKYFFNPITKNSAKKNLEAVEKPLEMIPLLILDTSEKIENMEKIKIEGNSFFSSGKNFILEWINFIKIVILNNLLYYLRHFIRFIGKFTNGVLALLIKLRIFLIKLVILMFKFLVPFQGLNFLLLKKDSSFELMKFLNHLRILLEAVINANKGDAKKEVTQDFLIKLAMQNSTLERKRLNLLELAKFHSNNEILPIELVDKLFEISNILRKLGTAKVKKHIKIHNNAFEVLNSLIMDLVSKEKAIQTEFKIFYFKNIIKIIFYLYLIKYLYNIFKNKKNKKHKTYDYDREFYNQQGY